MEKATAKGFWGTLLNPKSVLVMALPATLIGVLGFVAGTDYAEAKGPIALLTTTVAEVKASTGSALTDEADNSPDTAEWQKVRMRVTAYCPCPKCCGKYSDGVTACGHKIRPGDRFVAADKKYPFGTEMIVGGYNHGEAVKVLDRGGAIREDRLDVFFPSHEQALQWGVKYLDVNVRLR